MRRIFFVLGAALCSAGALAEEQGPSDESSSVFTSQQLIGELVSWDEETGALRIAPKEGRGGAFYEVQPFQMLEHSTVFYDGRIGNRQNLEEGQEVRVAWTIREEKQMIRWIEVLEEEEER